MSIATGTRLGRYEIRSKLGEGGMGEVYAHEKWSLGSLTKATTNAPRLGVADSTFRLTAQRQQLQKRERERTQLTTPFNAQTHYLTQERQRAHSTSRANQRQTQTRVIMRFEIMDMDGKRIDKVLGSRAEDTSSLETQREPQPTEGPVNRDVVLVQIQRNVDILCPELTAREV